MLPSRLRTDMRRRRIARESSAREPSVVAMEARERSRSSVVAKEARVRGLFPVVSDTKIQDSAS